MSRITLTRMAPRTALIVCATALFAGAARAAADGSAVPPPAAQPSVAAPAQTQPPAVAPPAAPASQFHDKTIRRSPRQEAARATAQSNNAATGEPRNGLDLPRVGLSLGAVIGAILVLKWFGARFFAPAKAAGRASRAVVVLTRTPLSPRQQLVLLQVGRRLVLVADGGAQANTLCEITDADEVAALVGQLNEDRFRATGGKPFGSVFGRFRRRYDGDDEAVSKGLAPEAFADDEDGQRGEEDGPAVGRVLARATSSAGGAEPDEPAVAEARQELNGLLEKVRLITKQYKAPS